MAEHPWVSDMGNNVADAAAAAAPTVPTIPEPGSSSWAVWQESISPWQ